MPMRETQTEQPHTHRVNLGCPSRSRQWLKATVLTPFSLALMIKHQGSGSGVLSLPCGKGSLALWSGRLKASQSAAGYAGWGSWIATVLWLCWPMPQKDLENVLSCHPQMISKSPPGSLCGTSCLAGSVSTEALCVLSSAVQVVGCVFLAREYRKKGDAKTLVLARRRGTADKQA